MTLGPNYFTRIQSKDFLRHWKSSDEHGANAFGPRYEGHRGKNRICCCSFLWGRGQVDAYTDHHRPIDRSDRSDEIMISQFISILFSLIGCLVTNSCPMMIATSNLCSSSGFFHAHKIAEKNEKRVFPKKHCLVLFYIVSLFRIHLILQMIPGSFQRHFWADRRQRHHGLGKRYHWQVGTECANSVERAQQNQKNLCFLSKEILHAIAVFHPMAGQSNCQQGDGSN